MGLPLPQARGPPIFSTFSMHHQKAGNVAWERSIIFLLLFFFDNRKLSSQQKELITQFARTENLTSGTVNGVSFEQEEGQWGPPCCN